MRHGWVKRDELTTASTHIDELPISMPSTAPVPGFAELYERYSEAVFRAALRVTGNPADAEDVLQEVFLSVWRDPSELDRSRGSFSSWLLAVVHHKAVDAVRREESQRRRQTQAEDAMALDAPTRICTPAEVAVALSSSMARASASDATWPMLLRSRSARSRS